MSSAVRSVVVLVSIPGFSLGALMFFYAAMCLFVHPPRGGPAAVLILLGLVIVATTIRLLQGKKWAWWSALLIAALVFVFGASCIWDAFYSRSPLIQSEATFAFLTGIFLTVVAAIITALLNLPPVRRAFFGERNFDSTSLAN